VELVQAWAQGVPQVQVWAAVALLVLVLVWAVALVWELVSLAREKSKDYSKQVLSLEKTRKES
jgi:hypothetical protein